MLGLRKGVRNPSNTCPRHKESDAAWASTAVCQTGPWVRLKWGWLQYP